MLERYREMFEIKLEVLKEQYAKDKSIENKKTCCRAAEWSKHELLGALQLISNANEITVQQHKEERERVMQTFSSVQLFGLELKEGELKCYGKGQANE